MHPSGEAPSAWRALRALLHALTQLVELKRRERRPRCGQPLGDIANVVGELVVEASHQHLDA
jgi:hypothetical protein